MPPRPRPGVHLVSPGLLQLNAVRHQRRTTSTPAVGVTTSHLCYGSCTGCQSVNANAFKIAGGAHTSVACWSGSHVLRRRLLPSVGRCRHPLRSNSNDMRKLLVPRTHNKLGDRSFSAAGPQLWNDLPPDYGTDLRLHQTISEIPFIWRPKHSGDSIKFTGAIQINFSICLFI